MRKLRFNNLSPHFFAFLLPLPKLQFIQHSGKLIISNGVEGNQQILSRSSAFMFGDVQRMEGVERARWTDRQTDRQKEENY